MRVLTIGRHPGSDVVVKDKTVGRYHAQIIQHDDGHFSLLDMNSKNGTFINGKLVNGEVRLNPGDVVQVGRATLPWLEYFSRPVQQPKGNKEQTILWTALGSFAGVLVTILFVVLFLGRTTKSNLDRIALTGPMPPATIVKIQEEGERYEVDAIEGQLVVIFSQHVSHKEASQLIKKNGAKIKAQMPNVHCYLIEVKPGSEGEMFSRLKNMQEVDFVYPNVVDELCYAVPHAIDNFQVDHGKQVVEMMQGCNPTLKVTKHDVGIDEKYVNMYLAIEDVEEILNNTKEESAVINMSFGPGLRRIGTLNPWQNRVLWNERLVSEGNKRSYIRRYINDIINYVKLVEPYNDKDFVIVKAAGNEGMKAMDDIISEINKSLTSHEREVFKRHFIIISAVDDNKELDYPNDVTNGGYNSMFSKVDISDMTAQSLHWQGTSFAAPRVAGYIVDLANKHDKKVVDVLQTVRNVTRSIQNHTITYELLEESLSDISKNTENFRPQEKSITPSTKQSSQIAESGIPASLIGTKWNAAKSLKPNTFEFIDKNHVKQVKQNLYNEWGEATYDCYYDYQKELIVALVRPGMYYFKYENGRLYSVSYTVSGGYHKSFEFERMK